MERNLNRSPFGLVLINVIIIIIKQSGLTFEDWYTYVFQNNSDSYLKLTVTFLHVYHCIFKSASNFIQISKTYFIRRLLSRICTTEILLSLSLLFYIISTITATLPATKLSIHVQAVITSWRIQTNLSD